MQNDTAIVIPARMASARLSNKILADINGKPMIQRVVDIALNSRIGSVLVATDSAEVQMLLSDIYGNKVSVVMTEDCNSGTDRIYMALKKIQQEFKYIINLQGDMPNLDVEVIRKTLNILQQRIEADVSTIVVPFESDVEAENPNDVKCAFGYHEGSDIFKAVYFSRSKIPANATTFYKHLGIYGYRWQSLEKFCTLPAAFLEKTEKLEQLRALENGMNIYVSIYNPRGKIISVDTEFDLQIARQIIL